MHLHRLSQLLTTIALSFALLDFLPACETATTDLKESFNWDMPSPSEAASWMFHRDPERRRLGISLISNAPFGGEDPYMEVYRAAVTDADPMVRAAAAHALSLHGDASDVPRLFPLLSDASSKNLRWETARALQRLHDPAAIDPLLDSLANDDDVDVRVACAIALGQYSDRRVTDGLVAALDDQSFAVNHFARRSLRILTGRDLGIDSLAWHDWFASASDPFAGGKQYLYPVFTRDTTWLERVSPFNKPRFEQPGIPAGMQPQGVPSSAPPIGG